MGILDSAIAGAATTLAAIEGRTVTIARGSDECDVTAVPGETETETIDSDGFLTQTKTRDYLLDAADYAPADTAVEPAIGDTITESIGGSLIVFQVVSPDGATPCFEYRDRARTLVRVHTKQVKA